MRRILAGLAGVWMLTMADSRALTIKIDYTYAPAFLADINNDAHIALEQAASDLANALTAANAAPLAAVPTTSFEGTTNGATITLDWSVKFNDPAAPGDKLKVITLPSFSLAADEFRVYAGATTALLGSGETLGEGAPSSGGYSLTPSGVGGDADENTSAIHKAENLFNAVMTRGDGPRLYVFNNHDHSEPDLDKQDFVDLGDGKIVDYTLNVGSLAGFLTFDTDATWHYNCKTAVGANEYDFYTVMLHEMMHSLGFGSSVSWRSKASGANWSGQHVIDLRGNVKLGNLVLQEFYNNDTSKPDGNHIDDTVANMSEIIGTTDLQSPVMVPDLAKGVRKQLTKLDIAFLLDLETPAPTPVSTATPTPTPTPTPSPTPVPTPPAPPIIAGKPPKRTTSSKVIIGGILDSPGAYVVYKIGNGPFLKAKGTGSWKITLKLKLGKNVITIASYDPVTDKTSNLKKITITRQ